MLAIDKVAIFEPELRNQIAVAVEQYIKAVQEGRAFFILFYGEPGTGKTLIAKIIVRAIKYHLIASGSTYKRFTIPEALTQQRMLFDSGRAVFFDEMDEIIANRDKQDSLMKAVSLDFMQRTGDKEYSIQLIGNTNRPDLVDKAFYRRPDITIRFYKPYRPETIAKVFASYFKERLQIEISLDKAELISRKLKETMSDDLAPAEIARIVEYIRMETIARGKPVTGQIIERVLLEYSEEQKGLRQSYTEKEIPPSPTELFQKYFEKVMGISLEKETALHMARDLEDMIEIQPNERNIEEIVRNINQTMLESGEPLTAEIITKVIKQFADKQIQLENSYIERTEKLYILDLIQDVVEEELDLELEDEEANTIAEMIKRLNHGRNPTDDIIEELVMAIKESTEATGEEANMNTLLNFIKEYQIPPQEIAYDKPYTSIPQLIRQQTDQQTSVVA